MMTLSENFRHRWQKQAGQSVETASQPEGAGGEPAADHGTDADTGIEQYEPTDKQLRQALAIHYSGFIAGLSRALEVVKDMRAEALHDDPHDTEETLDYLELDIGQLIGEYTLAQAKQLQQPFS